MCKKYLGMQMWPYEWCFSEVLHFLTGEEITNSLQTVATKRHKFGKVAISTGSIYSLQGLDDAFVKKCFEDKEKGIKWPGYYHSCNEVVEVLHKQGYDGYDWSAIATFANACVLSQITDEAEKSGFEIVRAKEGVHPGYPAGFRQIPRANIQVVARKL